MTGEEIGRDKKAKALVRGVLAQSIGVLRDMNDAEWFEFAERINENFGMPSEETRGRVIEILEGIAI